MGAKGPTPSRGSAGGSPRPAALPAHISAPSALLKSHFAICLERQRQGIEHTEGLLALALGELEAAREREEADLARRTAGLQARFAADMAELERGFLLQAEALQQRLAREVEEETARGQQALDALAQQMLAAADAADVVPAPLSAGGGACKPAAAAPGALGLLQRAPPVALGAAKTAGARAKDAAGNWGRPAISLTATNAAAPAAAAPRAPSSQLPPALQQATARLPADHQRELSASPGAQRRAGAAAAALVHESSSEFEDDGYWQGDDESEGEGGGPGSIAALGRPPAVKTVLPAGLSTLARQGSLPALATALKAPLAAPGSAAAPSAGLARPWSTGALASPRAQQQAQMARKGSSNPASPLLRYSPCLCKNAVGTSSLRFTSEGDD